MQSKVFATGHPAFTEVLTQLREYMLMDSRPKNTIIAYARSVCDLMEGLGKVPLDCTDEEVITHLNQYRDEHDLGSSTINARICVYHRLHKENGRKLVIPNPKRIKQIGEWCGSAWCRRRRRPGCTGRGRRRARCRSGSPWAVSCRNPHKTLTVSRCCDEDWERLAQKAVKC